MLVVGGGVSGGCGSSEPCCRDRKRLGLGRIVPPSLVTSLRVLSQIGGGIMHSSPSRSRSRQQGSLEPHLPPTPPPELRRPMQTLRSRRPGCLTSPLTVCIIFVIFCPDNDHSIAVKLIGSLLLTVACIHCM